MLYLSGAIREELMNVKNVGFMITPNMGNTHPEGVLWGADSGLFSTKGSREFDIDRYIEWMQERVPFQKDNLFITAPDVVGDWATTKRRSKFMLTVIRELGYKAALVAQDGLLSSEELEWDTFDCLFVGGTDAFKLAESTYALVKDAKSRGKWTHMGRVNSFARLKAAALSGYDSADGTYIAYGPDVNIPKLLAWIKTLDKQTAMFEL